MGYRNDESQMDFNNNQARSSVAKLTNVKAQEASQHKKYQGMTNHSLVAAVEQKNHPRRNNGYGGSVAGPSGVGGGGGFNGDSGSTQTGTGTA